MDDRRTLCFDHRIRNGWHWRDVYRHGRELDCGCNGIRMRHHFGAARRPHVFNRSHNGS